MVKIIVYVSRNQFSYDRLLRVMAWEYTPRVQYVHNAGIKLSLYVRDWLI